MNKAVLLTSPACVEPKEITEVHRFPSNEKSSEAGSDKRDDALGLRGVLPRIESGSRLIFEVVCAATALIFLAPLFAAIAAAVKWEDGGPVFFSQMRVGKDLRRFRLFKFRSMFLGSSESSLLTAAQDSRVTPLGRFLRKHKLDELPQLINVVKGEMQLVGVRPQMERYVGAFPREYRILLQDRPGIADLASLIFRNEEQLIYLGPVEKQDEHYVTKILPRKLQLSLRYRRTRTFLSDLKILFRTVLVLLSSATHVRSRNSHRLRLRNRGSQTG